MRSALEKVRSLTSHSVRNHLRGKYKYFENYFVAKLPLVENGVGCNNGGTDGEIGSICLSFLLTISQSAAPLLHLTRYTPLHAVLVLPAATLQRNDFQNI